MAFWCAPPHPTGPYNPWNQAHLENASSTYDIIGTCGTPWGAWHVRRNETRALLETYCQRLFLQHSEIAVNASETELASKGVAIRNCSPPAGLWNSLQWKIWTRCKETTGNKFIVVLTDRYYKTKSYNLVIQITALPEHKCSSIIGSYHMAFPLCSLWPMGCSFWAIGSRLCAAFSGGHATWPLHTVCKQIAWPNAIRNPLLQVGLIIWPKTNAIGTYLYRC